MNVEKVLLIIIVVALLLAGGIASVLLNSYCPITVSMVIDIILLAFFASVPSGNSNDEKG